MNGLEHETTVHLNGETTDADAEMDENLEEHDEEPILQLEFLDEVHQYSMLKSLNMMRKNRHFCDVILHVGNTEIHAHRAVLASASPYLFELFTTDQDQNQQARLENVITYKLNGGFDQNALEILTDYAYTAKLIVRYSQVRTVFLSASHLKMERVVKICAKHLIKHLSVDNCVEIRSLPGIARNKDFIQQIDVFISKNFAEIVKSNNLLHLYCAKLEVLSQSKEEMSFVNQSSLCRLVLEWIKRQIANEHINKETLLQKTFMLYLALDNSLQDCLSLPSGDVSDTEIVQDYKKMSLKNTGHKTKKKALGQPSKPRVLIYNREIGEELENEIDSDWNLIASESVGDHSFLALVTLGGKLGTLSIQLRLNPPQTPSPTSTPAASRSQSEEKPDLYCALTNMTSQRCAHGCGDFDGTLIVCGGYDRVECLRTVEQYIPESNVWKNLPTMRESRGRFKIAVVNKKVYAIGGSNGTTELDSVEMLDMDVGKWVKMPPMPIARSNLGVSELNGLIYCVGGWNGQVGLKQCDIFNPDTQEWSTMASLNTGRYQAGVTSYRNLVYAIGGCDAWNCLSSVEVYNPEDDSWKGSKPINTARRGCGVAVFNDKLYVVGGSDGSHSLNTTEVFDDDTQTWSGGPSMTTTRANVEVAVVGDKLYAVGGFSGKTFLNTIEYLDPKSNEWTTFIPKGTCETIARRKPRSRKNSRKSISEDSKKSSSIPTPSEILRSLINGSSSNTESVNS